MIFIAQGRPFFFTFFLSDRVSLHATTVEKAEQVLERHVGTMITPPASLEQYKALGDFRSKVFEVVFVACLFIPSLTR